MGPRKGFTLPTDIMHRTRTPKRRIPRQGPRTAPVANGSLHARTHATHPVARIGEAIAAASASERDESFLVTGGAT